MRKTRELGAGKIGLLCLAVGALAAALLLSPAVRAEEGFGEQKFKVGQEATDFSTMDVDGNTVTLSSFRGKNVVLLNFWGVRCGACIEEMPKLNEIWAKYKERGLVILGVDTDGIDGPMLLETMKEVGIKADYTLLVDTEFTITDTYTNFLVPLTLVIDKKGVVTYIHTGYEKGMEKEYEKAVLKALES